MTKREDQEKLDKHRAFEGKCFIASSHYETRRAAIKAFKILNVMESKCNYAVCLALVHVRVKESQWSERGILIMPLDLWTPNKDCSLPDSGDSLPKVIDFFNEITEEEFEEQYLEFLHFNEITEEELEEQYLEFLRFIGSPEYSKELRDIPLDRIMGAKETTAFLGITITAFCNWRNRYADFPKPIVQLTATPLFDKLEVIDWAIKNGKLS